MGWVVGDDADENDGDENDDENDDDDIFSHI